MLEIFAIYHTNGQSEIMLFILPAIFETFNFLVKHYITHQRSLFSLALKAYIVYWGVPTVSGVHGPKGCSETGWSMSSLKLYKHL